MPSSTDFEGRIVGGIAHNIKEFPFFASLKRYGHHTCGGSILTEKYIISAAHCFTSGRPYDWTVVLGISERSQEGSEQSFTSLVDAIIIHEDYNPNTLVNDIALLRLAKSIPKWTEMIQPACIRWTEDVYLQINDPVYVIGMGLTKEGGSSTSGQLLGVGLSFLSTTYCNEQFRAEYILSGMLCAGYPPGGKDACQADSGGPLLHAGTGRVSSFRKVILKF